MNPVALFGRWILAIVAAIVTCAVAGLLTLVMYMFVDIAVFHEARAQIESSAMSIVNFAAWMGAIGGMSAGALTLPATQRKSFILWFGGLCVVCLVLYTIAQVANGHWSNFTTVGIFATVMGGSWVKQHLWKSPPPNFEQFLPDEEPPPPSRPPVRPTATNVRVSGSPASRARPSFGRRG